MRKIQTQITHYTWGMKRFSRLGTLFITRLSQVVQQSTYTHMKLSPQEQDMVLDALPLSFEDGGIVNTGPPSFFDGLIRCAYQPGNGRDEIHVRDQCVAGLRSRPYLGIREDHRNVESLGVHVERLT